VSNPAQERLFDQAVQRHQSGHVVEAESLYRQLLQSNPNDADAMQMLGLLTSQTGRPLEALPLLQKAVQINPDAADYHYHLGMVLAKLHRPQEAMTEFELALALEQQFPEVLLEMGILFEKFGRLDESIRALRQAVALQPDLAEAWEHLTDTLRDQGRLEDAIAAGLKSVALQPKSPSALTHLGIAYHYSGRYDDAIAQFRQALEIDPAYAAACANLANALYSSWDVPQSLVFYRKSVSMKHCDPRYHSNLLYALHLQDTLAPAEMFQEHLKWAQVHVQPPRDLPRPHPNDRTKSRPLRIGYVSPDFRGHSVSFFIENLLAHHDPRGFEVYCYSDTHNPDATTTRLASLQVHWRNILGIDDPAVVEIIREDQIDILVDLAGHTAYHRLLVFAKKPAPIQVTYLGYPDTTGLEAMDYRFTDSFADPPGNTDQFHTEELVRLPRTFLCYRPPPEFPQVSPLPAAETGNITFGSLNHLAKINPSVIELWSRVLRSVPGSRILIKCLRGLEYAPTQHRLLELFARQGIDDRRVLLRAGVPAPLDHIKTYHEIDIALDTFPYNGTTTTCESLWMGVPVVTLAGKRHAGRVGVSLLSNAGLHEWIAQDADHYVRIAREMSGQPHRLAAARAQMRQKLNRSPILDAAEFARNIESVYRNLWRRWLGS
jgi:predicted O-linked N-acetylglucosamine transferase (SPINDLY family)